MLALLLLLALIAEAKPSTPSPNDAAWRFVFHPVDTAVGESDGLSLIDLSGDGHPDPISATGTSGAVFRYERTPEGSWRRHKIADGFVKAEGSAAADVDGDGRPTDLAIGVGSHRDLGSDPQGLYFIEVVPPTRQ